MARLLIGMWLLLIVSLSSMFFLMGDFLSERKHVEVSAPTERPYARVPRNSTDEASVGLAVIDVEEPAVPRAEPDDEPSARQLSEDDLESQPNLALSPNTEQTKQLKSVSVSAPRAESAPAPVYSKKVKRRGSLERRRIGGRFGKRRLFR
jgi:hypothetical protein